jgi:transposase
MTAPVLTCRDADRRRRGLPDHIDRVRLRDGVPQTTVEALIYSLRSGGSALTESNNLRRLRELSEPQLHEVCARLQKFKPHIARAWTPAEVEILVGTWAEFKHG